MDKNLDRRAQGELANVVHLRYPGATAKQKRKILNEFMRRPAITKNQRYGFSTRSRPVQSLKHGSVYPSMTKRCVLG